MTCLQNAVIKKSTYILASTYNFRIGCLFRISILHLVSNWVWKPLVEPPV